VVPVKKNHPDSCLFVSSVVVVEKIKHASIPSKFVLASRKNSHRERFLCSRLFYIDMWNQTHVLEDLVLSHQAL
jgi:hypothetical protein